MYHVTSVLTINCKPSGGKALGGLVSALYGLGQVLIMNCTMNIIIAKCAKGFLELTKWCAPLQKGLVRTLHDVTEN